MGVAVSTVDEDKVYAILKQRLSCKIRPKLKGSDGRFLMPEGTSLFGDVSEGSTSGYAPQSSQEYLGTDWRELPIKRTILHLPEASVNAPRTALSAPAVL